MAQTESAAAAPALPKKKVFHGWYIVGVGFLTHLAFSAALSSTLGVFFKPMSEEFGWSRSYLSGVRSFESLFAGIVASAVGPILDRHGTRLVVVFGGIIGGLGIILLGFVGDSLQFFIVRGLIVCIGTTAFGHMVTSVAISNWFISKRGRALGISGSGLGLGKVFLAPLITALLVVSDWRVGWVILGAVVLVLVPLPAFFLMRRRPEDMGLRPDGLREPDGAASGMASIAVGLKGAGAGEAIWTRGEAVHTSAFWLIVLTFGVANIGSQGMALHTIPYLTDIGFSPQWAAGAVSVLAVFQLSGTLGWGFVIERFPIRYGAVSMFLLEAVGIALVTWFRAPVPIILGLIAYGFCFAGTAVMQDMIWASYFGRLSLGTVRSIGMPLMVAFSAGGPLYFGYLYDVTGGYETPLTGFMVALLISVGLVLACHPPKRSAGIKD